MQHLVVVQGVVGVGGEAWGVENLDVKSDVGQEEDGEGSQRIPGGKAVSFPKASRSRLRRRDLVIFNWIFGNDTDSN